MSIDFAARARALVGCRFRAQGRDRLTGLDCVGVLVETFGIAASTVPRTYRLRGHHRKLIERELGAHFRKVARTQRRSGDVMLLDVAAGQLHLAVSTDCGFVHADARLGKIVETPGEPAWPLCGVWRRRSRRRAAWQL